MLSSVKDIRAVSLCEVKVTPNATEVRELSGSILAPFFIEPAKSRAQCPRFA
jgi:hypothetical protein